MTQTDAGLKPIEITQNIRWLAADTETPISLYLKIIGDGDGILLESAEVDGRWGRHSILATDFCFYISCEAGKFHIDIADARFQELKSLSGLPFMEGCRKALEAIRLSRPGDGGQLPPIARAIYGYVGFEMSAVFNPHLQNHIPVDEAKCLLALPGTVLVFDHLYNRLCQLSLGRPAPLAAKPESESGFKIDWNGLKSEPSENGYKDFARNIRNQLYQGEAIQVVPSTRFSAPFSGNPFTVYRKLRRLNASPYMFYMKFPQLALFGSSPEVMVGCAANRLLLAPIAGTRKRGATTAEDDLLAEELLADPKDRAEHVMLVDLGRNDLGRIAEPGTVDLERFMDIERFSHVMHLTSRVTARLAEKGPDGEKRDALDILAATFPAGTVSGAPKMRALEIIRSLEKRPRGPYAGCVGWIGLDKDSVNMDMGITIRAAWVKDDRMHWQAGGGIVHDSDPEMEWLEVLNKSAVIKEALKAEEEEYVSYNR